MDDYDKIVESDGNLLIFQCPHCHLFTEVLVSELNCRIFRHAKLKNTDQQINPHTTQQECERLLRENLVDGCTKPFIIMQIANTKYEVNKCDYI